ncbi:MAG: hypothetical protein J6H18_04255, partial [Lachnospiraceae bacterium]|nr:hypothetical protein [Lachnospiraceae bacterium]
MHKRFRSSVFSRSSFRPAGVLILILSLLLSACASGPEKSDSAGTLPDGLFAGQTTSAGTLAPQPTTAPTTAPTEAPTTAPTT